MSEMTASEAMLALGCVTRADFNHLVSDIEPIEIRAACRGGRIFDADDILELAARVRPPTGAELKRWGDQPGTAGPTPGLIRAWNKTHPDRQYHDGGGTFNDMAERRA